MAAPMAPAPGGDSYEMSGDAECGHASRAISNPRSSHTSILTRAIGDIKKHIRIGHDVNPYTTKQEVRKIEEYRRGYPRVSAFMSSHPVFMMCRSFVQMRSNLLLLKQAELCQLEEELHQLEEEEPSDQDIASWKLYSGESRRQKLLNDIEAKLVEYDAQRDAILALKNYPSVQERDYTSYKNYLNIEKDILPGERTFISHRRDMISLSQNDDHTPLGRAVEFVVHRTLLRNYFKGKKYISQTDNKHLHLYSTTRIKRTASVISTIIAVAVLVGPIIALKYIPDVDRVWYLIFFTILFAFSILGLTKAKKHELFAATAAFCAVLVVFIGRPGN